MPPLHLTTVQVAKMAAKEDSECATKQPVPGQADAKQTTKNKMVAAVKKDASPFSAFFYVIAAALYVTFVPHNMKPTVASKLAENRGALRLL